MATPLEIGEEEEASPAYNNNTKQKAVLEETNNLKIQESPLKTFGRMKTYKADSKMIGTSRSKV